MFTCYLRREKFGIKEFFSTVQEQPPRRVLKKRFSENMQQMYRRTPIPMCNFNKVALQLFWNHTLAWVFSCTFDSYFQNTFFKSPSGWLLLTVGIRLNYSEARLNFNPFQANVPSCLKMIENSQMLTDAGFG